MISPDLPSFSVCRTSFRAVIAAFVVLAVSCVLVGCGGAQSYAVREDTGGGYAPGAPRPASEPAYAEEADSDEGYWGGEAELVDYAPTTERGVEPEPAPTGGKDKPAPNDPEPTGEQAGPKPDVAKTTETEDVPKKRIIIYVAEVGLMVFEVPDTIETIRAETEAVGGWVQQSTSTSLTIRVPVESFEALVEKIASLGDVSYKNVVGTDVTEEFFDLSIRLNNAMALRARYLELLKKATTIKDSLAIEREIGRLTEEIERFKGRLRFLRQHAAFSTIRVTLTEKPDVWPSARVPLPFGWLRNYRIENLF